MTRRTFGPHRGADWLGRVALPEPTHTPASERFVLRLRDPRHARSLWVSWTLDHGRQASALHVDLLFVDLKQRITRHIKESWPLDRLLADPERMGLGVGECQLTQGASVGLLREEAGAVAWDASFAAGAPESAWAPKPRWLSGHRLHRKSALLTTSSPVEHGYIELWGPGRQAPKQRIDTTGWLTSVTHLWGHGTWRPYAALEARLLLEGEPIEVNVITYPNRLLGVFGCQSLLGRARVGNSLCEWTGVRQLFQTRTPSLGAEGWTLALASQAGQLDGQLQLPAEGRISVPGPGGSSLLLSETATLEATLKLAGQPPRHIRSERVSFEGMVPSSP